MDLARAFCLAGRLDEARASTQRVLEFNPDMSVARLLLKNLDTPHPDCNEN
jgi:hypothetical protein